MLEIFLYIVLVAVLIKIALVDNRSPFLWGAIAVGVCAATLYIPLPHLRVLIAGVLCILVMTGAKIVLRQ